MKKRFTYIGWAGQFKEFNSLKACEDSAKKEGIGFVSIRKNGEFLKTIKTEHRVH